MIATAANCVRLIEAMPSGTVAILSDVEWEEYEKLLEDIGEARHLRLTYNNGNLQIMTLTLQHQTRSGLIPPLILILAEELDQNFLGLGSATFKHRNKGTDPDDCYYFKNFKLIAGKKQLDLNTDPPPELAIEIDINNSSSIKFPVYATIGVSELWIQIEDEIRFYILDFDHYVESPNSRLFPLLPAQSLFSFLKKGEEEGAIAMGREFRKWIRTQRKTNQ